MVVGFLAMLVVTTIVAAVGEDDDDFDVTDVLVKNMMTMKMKMMMMMIMLMVRMTPGQEATSTALIAN